MRILVIEDDPSIAASIEFMLKKSGHVVQLADVGEEGIDLGKIYDYDAITSDIDLPDMLGFEVVRQLRAAKIKTPILMLSGRAAIDDKVKALSLGADDYLTKPFHKAELLARLDAVFRRSKGHAQSVISIGNMNVDITNKVATVDGNNVHLTGKEYKLLEMLATRQNQTVTREQILGYLYGGRDEPEMKIIDVFICKLRKKIRLVDGPYIEVVWGRGYRLPSTVAEKAA